MVSAKSSPKRPIPWILKSYYSDCGLLKSRMGKEIQFWNQIQNNEAFCRSRLFFKRFNSAFWLVEINLGLLAGGGWGHGRLMNPPGRGSVWTFIDSNPLISDKFSPHIVRIATQNNDRVIDISYVAYGNPKYSSIINIDYTDQGLNCGGLSYQVSQGMGMQSSGLNH